MRKLMGIVCFIRGRHFMIFDSGTRAATSHIVRMRCSTCGHQDQAVIPIGVC